MSDSKRPGHLHIADPVQCAADAAPTLAAIRSAAEDTGFHTRSQVGRIVQRRLREQAVIRVLRRSDESPSHSFRQQQLRIHPAQLRQLPCHAFPIFRCEPFGTFLSNLRTIQAHPNVIDFRPGVPECEVFLQIGSPRQHWTGNHPMHVDRSPLHILEDALVRSGLAPLVMMFGKSIHRNGHTQACKLHPLLRNCDHAAGHHHREDAHIA